MGPARTHVIGTSGHVNTYRSGVLINNHVEDAAGTEFQASGRHVLGFGAPFSGMPVQKTSYVEHDLSGGVARHDKGASQGVGADLLLRHGDFLEPRAEYFVTLNQLTMPDDRQLGEPRVATYTWTGSNHHDANVPATTFRQEMTARKSTAHEQEDAANPYATTSRAGQLTAALAAAVQPCKQGTVRAQTDGQASTVGRKPVGPHADEVGKTYRRIGLRSNYYSGNVA